ncbi:MAG: right-handed parallel beta-helix repeat-containing protein [Ignavibacteriota bacterium]
MENSSIEPAGPGYAGLELPQRNSQDVVFQNVTFKAANVVFGEYAAHWKLTGNQFWIYPDRSTSAGIATGGLDVEASQNVIHGENLTAGGGSGALLTDGIGPGGYVDFIGREVFRGNTIECRADGNNCVRLTTRDPVFDGNHITTGGYATGIKVEGAATSFAITNNTIAMGPLPALVLNVADLSTAVVKGNVISGSGSHAIVVGGQSAPTVVDRLATCQFDCRLHRPGPQNRRRLQVREPTSIRYRRRVDTQGSKHGRAKTARPRSDRAFANASRERHDWPMCDRGSESIGSPPSSTGSPLPTQSQASRPIVHPNGCRSDTAVDRTSHGASSSEVTERGICAAPLSPCR